MSRFRRAQYSHSSARGGFTLVELLVAATLALVVMGALASLFSVFARSFNDSQKLVDMSNAMRSASWRLRQDLQGLTCEVKPWVRPEANAGYFELTEGSRRQDATGPEEAVADIDDILMFTTASPGKPFIGRLAGATGFESPVAEVAWFCRKMPNSDLYNLYRRQLLVSAAPGAGDFQANNSMSSTTGWNNYFLTSDISVRRDGGVFIPNSLGDLTKRESRFLHNVSGAANAAGFPFPVDTNADGAVLTGVREGEDIVLSNVIAFDVRVYNSGTATTNPLKPPLSYVDLVETPAAKSKLATSTWDTWSYHYEYNGIDEDSAGGPDQAANRQDDNGDGAVDDVLEMETSPPTITPIRGIEIRIRCFEPSSKQVRQMTVQHSFLAR